MRFRTYVVISMIFWGLAAFILSSVLESHRRFCDKTEGASGLAAECFAPAALIYTLLFAGLLLLDLIRLTLTFMADRKPASKAEEHVN